MNFEGEKIFQPLKQGVLRTKTAFSLAHFQHKIKFSVIIAGVAIFQCYFLRKGKDSSMASTKNRPSFLSTRTAIGDTSGDCKDLTYLTKK